MSQRNYGIDLLRLVLMYMVCLLHTLGQGGLLQAAAPGSAGFALLWLLEVLASCAVDGVAVESGAHVSLLKAGASAEIVLRSKAAVEGDTLTLDSPVNLAVAEAALVLQNLPEGVVVSGTEPFDQIIQE